MQLLPLDDDQPVAGMNLTSSITNQVLVGTRVIDDEFGLRQAFVEDASQGCSLLFRRYYANLVNHAVRFVYSKEVAEDLVVEVFTNFWQERSFERITTSYRAYLYTAVRYRAYNYLRWELHHTEWLDSVGFQPHSVALQPDQLLHYSELHQKIDRVIQNLSPQCQRAFLLSRIEGKKYAEIAQDLQISHSGVEKLLMKALSKLRQELKSDWFITGILWLSIGSLWS